MRKLFALIVCTSCSLAFAQERERFVERTPPPRVVPEHTAERAGNPTALSRFAVQSLGRYDGIGYVNGNQQTGTFGLDFIGFRFRPGRVFLGEPRDPSRGRAISDGYRTDPGPVPDIFGLRPVRKAVIEDKEHSSSEKK